MKLRRILTIMTLLGLAILLVACGGNKKSTTQSVESDGRVYLENKATWGVKSSYFNEETAKQIEETVAPGERKEISQGVIKYGTKVTFSFTGIPPAGVIGVMPQREIEVTINGNMVIRVTEVSHYIFNYIILTEG